MRETGKTWLKRTIAGSAVALALVGGGTVVFARTQSAPAANGVQSLLDDVASRLGVQPSVLQNAIQQAETDQVNQAVESGKLTSQQAQKVENAIKSGKLQWGAFLGGKRGPSGGSDSGVLTNAASYLGITSQALRTQLESGKTVAQIANSTSGKSAAGLQQYLVKQAQTGPETKLDMAVKDGRITQTQANQLLQQALKQAQTKIGSLMNHTFKLPGPGRTPTSGSSGR